jgi:TonB family protein
MLLKSLAMFPVLARNSVAAIALVGSVAVHAGVVLGMPEGRGEPHAQGASLVTTAPPSSAAIDEIEAPEDAPLAAEVAAASQLASTSSPSAASHALAPRSAPVASPANAPVVSPRPAPRAPDTGAATKGEPEPLRFALGVVPATGNASAPNSVAAGRTLGVGESQREGDAVDAADATDRASAVYGEDEVDSRPRLLSWHAPRYPDAAASAGVEADVPVDVVIDTEGAVIDATPAGQARRAGYGLDAAAMAAARSYRFSRGVRAGRPVRVRMRCTVMFRLN